MAKQILKCLQVGCGRTGDDIGQCGAFQTCPKEGVPVVPGKDVIIKNHTTGVTRVYSAHDILRGKAFANPNVGENDEVTAVVLSPKDAPPVKPAKPVKVTPEEAPFQDVSEETTDNA